MEQARQVEIGTVEVPDEVASDKEQLLRIGGEWAELYSAWRNWKPLDTPMQERNPYSWSFCPEYRFLLDKCAGIIQEATNLMAALGVEDATALMERCQERAGCHKAAETPDETE